MQSDRNSLALMTLLSVGWDADDDWGGAAADRGHLGAHPGQGLAGKGNRNKQNHFCVEALPRAKKSKN